MNTLTSLLPDMSWLPRPPKKPHWWQFWRRAAYKRDYAAWAESIVPKALRPRFDDYVGLHWNEVNISQLAARPVSDQGSDSA